MKRVIVIGAGPMGLEAALLAGARGFDVTVLEGGDVGESLRRWGPTRTFSPLSMNVSPRARALVGGVADDALLTGP
ncbi:MAG: putative bacillithiol system oxidoreductase, YpdA family, partial [bacterium]|nr:putative bacillithiol system oxidoreductase, YpdA family [bacterium]